MEVDGVDGFAERDYDPLEFELATNRTASIKRLECWSTKGLFAVPGTEEGVATLMSQYAEADIGY